MNRMIRSTPVSRTLICIVLCIYAILLLLPLTVSADTPVNGGTVVTGQVKGAGYTSRLYDADSGLPTSEANTVYSSSDGFIWIGGYSGLIRYDGSYFERQDSTDGITSVNDIFEDSKGRLWIGTNDNGVICISKGESLHYSYDEGLASSSIDSIAEDKYGNIFIGTRLGVYYFDENMSIRLVNDSQLKNAYIRKLIADVNGNICGITQSGAVFRIKDMRMTEYYNGSDIGTDQITAILPSPNKADEVWLGTNSGMVCRGSFADNFSDIEKILIYSDTVITEEDPRTGDIKEKTVTVISSEPVNYISFSAGRIWALTNSSIFYTDAFGIFRRVQDIPLNGGLENMTEDWEGNLWFASRRQGVMKITPNKFLDLTDTARLDTRIVNSTCIHNGLLYIGTDTGLQITDADYHAITNDLIDYVGNSRIRCIAEDNDGNLWISTYTNDLGLLCLSKDGQLTDFTEANGFISNKVRCTATAPDGAVLAATNSGLAVIRNGSVQRFINEEKGLNNPVILTIETTDDGKYYLGTDGDGIYVVDGNNITHLFHEDGLTSDVVMRIKKDPKKNVLWIVTSNSIEYMKDGVITPVRNFPYTNNYDIYFDSSENAWILSSNGIYVVNADDMISKEQFNYVFYNCSSGLPSVPTGNSFSCTDDKGNLYICGRSGVSCVNIDNYFVQSQDIKFSVPFIDDGKNRYYPDENGTFTLPPTAMNITVYCYALTFMMHDPQIQYFLKGADHEPITVDKSDMAPVRYTNLGGGKYEFELSLLDNSSHTVRQTVTFRINKQRAFYEQWWFFVLCAAAAVFIMTLLARLYLRRKTAVFRIKEEEQKKLKRLFKQTATALVNAIDAKDKYTHGHSARVADYSKRIAKLYGKDEQECDEIYYAALLHDVGKIGIPNKIINKDGRLTDEEYAAIKQHPLMGAQILFSISEYPYLSIGAKYHHERYDGRGYPDGLKGDDIPELARIVSVADAYDAMTSKRSYRDPIPQQKVREEFVKGSGTQFDPKFAKIMLHLIDLDTEYDMKEREDIKELAGTNELIVGKYRSAVSEGIAVTSCMTTIYMKIFPDKSGNEPVPSLILFDALDGRVHFNEKDVKELVYFEYGELWLDGHTVTSGARKMQSSVVGRGDDALRSSDEYKLEAVKISDHVLVRIFSKDSTIEIITALPDSVRFAYLGLTGEHCRISDVRIDKAENETAPDYIPRIAEEITFIGDPAGDIPNIQVNGYRTDHTAGIPIKDGMKLSFHTMSLPTARLVWHCTYIDIFSSADGKVNGENYTDFMFMRLDGECWECDDGCDTTLSVQKSSDFDGWETWKKFNKEGFDCTVTFGRKGNTVTMTTENGGISVKITAKITAGADDLYAALTGDQCAVTNIHIT